MLIEGGCVFCGVGKWANRRKCVVDCERVRGGEGFDPGDKSLQILDLHRLALLLHYLIQNGLRNAIVSKMAASETANVDQCCMHWSKRI